MKITIKILAVLFFSLISVGVSNGQTGNLSGSSTRQNETDKPLKIIKKPFAKDWNCSQAEGLTKVRATFDKTAKISSVEILESSGCVSFDEEAVRVAKRIKFEPAIKNGETVTITKSLQYSFQKRY